MTIEHRTLTDTFEASLSTNGIAASYARAPLQAWSAAIQGVCRFWTSAIERGETPLMLLIPPIAGSSRHSTVNLQRGRLLTR
jgi:hypothetical protein